MKFFFVFLEIGFSFFFSELTFSKLQNSENDSLYNLLVDSTQTGDSSTILHQPTFYSFSNLLFGAEILDPLHPKDFFTRATRLWKSDIRLGISQPIGNYITSFFSFRDQDSPETNSLKMYEAFVKINHGWGNLYFGQRRVQAGYKTYYLNDAFDRIFWDKGLVYDFLMRGIESNFRFNNNELNFFLGSDFSSGFIGGTKYFVQPLTCFNVQASALYIARDPQYAAFGFQFGVEIEESFEKVKGYQIVAYKTFDQEPAQIKEITFFSELRYTPYSKWELGTAVLYKRMKSILYMEELRTSIDVRYKADNIFIPALRAEFFNIASFYEIHLGAFAYLQYTKHIRIVPRIRYIITEFGPNIGFLGIEGQIDFGSSE